MTTIRCRDCGKHFATPARYHAHLNSAHGDTDDEDLDLSDAPPGLDPATAPFKCDVCGREFNFLRGLTRHRNHAHEQNQPGLPPPKTRRPPAPEAPQPASHPSEAVITGQLGTAQITVTINCDVFALDPDTRTRLFAWIDDLNRTLERRQ